MMKEDLLHYIWKYRLYRQSDLITSSGEPVEIVRPGSYNTNAGADFANASIRIGNVKLVGNIEIHVHAKDWYEHGHEKDPAYNNTILHVVYESDNKPTLLQNGQALPILVLKDLIDPKLLSRYMLLQSEKGQIPCATLLSSLEEQLPMSYLTEQLLVERLQAKVSAIETLLYSSTNDWDQVAFRLIATYYGASVNKEPFALLAASLPLTVLHKHRNDPMQIEALLFGQAGMLERDFDDEYPQQLKREYKYLRRLHALTPIQEQSWKFFRIRPVNFPTIKIAQLAALVTREEHLFDSMLHAANSRSLHELLNAEIHPYWQTHFQFDKPVNKAITSIGTILTDVVLINAVAPLLFAYGRYKDDEDLCNKVLDMLHEVAAEDNAIIRMWADLGIKAKTAADTQALIQLKNQYCDQKRCLSCQIGHRLLK